MTKNMDFIVDSYTGKGGVFAVRATFCFCTNCEYVLNTSVDVS